jgi:hypothetical protein
MGSMFTNAAAFNQNISSWNTASVSIRGMLSMFGAAVSFNQNLAAWNTAKLSDMTGMFSRAAAFNQNLAAWNVASVSSMQGMFQASAAFDQDLAGWNVLSVTSFSSAPLRLRPLRRCCAHMPPSLRLVVSRPAEHRPEYVFCRAASDVCIRHVPPTEWSLELQAPSPTPSA